jgi:hypothetical protein
MENVFREHEIIQYSERQAELQLWGVAYSTFDINSELFEVPKSTISGNKLKKVSIAEFILIPIVLDRGESHY